MVKGDPAAGAWRPYVSRVLNRYGILLAWVAVIAFFGALRPDIFLTWQNFQTIFGSQAVLLVLTLGLVLSLVVGEFDVSIGGVMSLSMVLVGYLNVLHSWPIGLATAVALAAGLVVGAANAYFIVVVGVESLIATLGMGTLLVGVGLGINNQTTGGVSDDLVNAVRHQILGLPLAFFYGLLLTVIVWYLLTQTPLGRHMFFVGAGKDVARLSGIRVDMIRTGALLASGFVSALAGVMLSGVLGASDPNVGATFLLPAFAAAFLGSTAISPGRFNAWGTFIAVYFLITGITGLQFLGLAGWIEQVFYGGSLLLAVALSRLAVRAAEAQSSRVRPKRRALRSTLR